MLPLHKVGVIEQFQRATKEYESRRDGESASAVSARGSGGDDDDRLRPIAESAVRTAVMGMPTLSVLSREKK